MWLEEEERDCIGMFIFVSTHNLSFLCMTREGSQ
jgi:hypothetical protein